jgi:hypothetical protein
MRRLVFLVVFLLFSTSVFSQGYSRVDRDLSTVEIDQVIKTGGVETNAHVVVHIVDIDGNIYDNEWWIGEALTAAVVNGSITKAEAIAKQGKRGYDALHVLLNPPTADIPEAPSASLSGMSAFGDSDVTSSDSNLDTKITAKQAEIAVAETIAALAQSTLAALQLELSVLLLTKQ